MKKHFISHFKRHTLVSITSGLVVLSISSRLIGLIRDRLLTSQFGTSGVLDSYFSAFRVPDLVYNILILGTLSSAFIPLFSKFIHRKDRLQDAQDLVDDVLLIVGIVMGLLACMMILFAPYLVKIVAISYDGQKLQDTIDLTRIMAVSPLIFSISSIVGSILNSYKKFFIVALAPILYNIGIIIGIIYLYPIFGVMGLGYGVVLGALLHLLIQLPTLLSLDFPFRFTWNINTKNLKRLWNLYWPRLLVLDTAIMSMFIGTIIASAQPDAVTYFTLAFNLNSLPLGVIALSFAVAIFPYLTEAYAKKDEQAFRDHIIGTISKNLLILIPVMMLMLNFRSQLVRIVYGGGVFDWEATQLTYQTFTMFALSIPFQGLIPLFSRALYARHNTITPMIIGIGSMGINVILSLILSHYWGVVGVAGAFSLTILITCIWYGIIIFRTINHGSIMKTFRYGLQIGLVSLGMTIIAYISKTVIGNIIEINSLLTVLIQVIGSSIPALTFYVFVTWKLNLVRVLQKPLLS
jgi:putative peptidoglycan lipid II flippase